MRSTQNKLFMLFITVVIAILVVFLFYLDFQKAEGAQCTGDCDWDGSRLTACCLDRIITTDGWFVYSTLICNPGANMSGPVTYEWWEDNGSHNPHERVSSETLPALQSGQCWPVDWPTQSSNPMALLVRQRPNTPSWMQSWNWTWECLPMSVLPPPWTMIHDLYLPRITR